MLHQGGTSCLEDDSPIPPPPEKQPAGSPDATAVVVEGAVVTSPASPLAALSLPPPFVVDAVGGGVVTRNQTVSSLIYVYLILFPLCALLNLHSARIMYRTSQGESDASQSASLLAAAVFVAVVAIFIGVVCPLLMWRAAVLQVFELAIHPASAQGAPARLCWTVRRPLCGKIVREFDVPVQRVVHVTARAFLLVVTTDDGVEHAVGRSVSLRSQGMCSVPTAADAHGLVSALRAMGHASLPEPTLVTGWNMLKSCEVRKAYIW